ncbi:Uncharacterized conserved protein [Anaerocolumna jejuensis DSM 15929]|uniref:Uncharacterized conserved protein n=1 Tax=Anaerocolumna jejuensis DSM 15929 TaxID=1121322 RepID=A0A1M7B5X1_9FIRM|nr:6-hydroxymethylpterin diphosphokinase MptE-like protein [Anaerocolumna jejuensis]SHL50039.1 Uncharacterized conserved protein [Anaerocolumna jejuensis DSM 15929]
MMDFYEKNTKAMEKIKNSLFCKLDSKEKVECGACEISSEEAKDSSKILFLADNSGKYRLNSMYSPENEAKIWAEQFDFYYINAIIAMFGLANGYMAREVRRRMNTGSCLIIYEPSCQVFLHILNNYDISDILEDENVILIVKGINEKDFHNYYGAFLGIENAAGQLFIVHPKYDIIFAMEFRDFYKEIRDANVHMSLNNNTRVRFAEKDIENILLNLPYLKDSVSLYELAEVLPVDIPAVIVAAGPSVEESIEQLKEIKGRAVIVAVDRVLDFLLDNGIKPDMLVTLDGIKKLEYFSRRSNIHIPMVCRMESSHAVMNAHKGMKIIYCDNEYVGELFRITGHIPPFVTSGASVATTAFECCLAIGIKKIILVGQDLAYKDGKSHMGGITEEIGQDDVYVEGVNGKMVRSRYDWKEYLAHFNDRIRNTPEVEVIDTKLEGAKIERAKYIPLKDVIDDLPDRNFNMEQFCQSISRITAEEYNKVQKYMQNSLLEIDQILENAEKGLKNCRQLLKGKIDKNKEKRLGRKLLELNDTIYGLKSFSLMDDLVTTKNSIDLDGIYYFSEDLKENNRITYEKAAKLYEIILEVGNDLKTRIEDIRSI